MEDLDTPRVVPGCADAASCARSRPSACTGTATVELPEPRAAPVYRAALEQLQRQRRHLRVQLLAARAAATTRRRLSGHLPRRARDAPGPTATRFRVPASAVVSFDDRLQGHCDFDARRAGGCRRPAPRWRASPTNSPWSSTMPRRASPTWCAAPTCCDSTAWQIALQRALALPTPRYAHLPAGDRAGRRAKLAKSRRSVALRPGQAGAELCAGPGAAAAGPTCRARA